MCIKTYVVGIAATTSSKDYQTSVDYQAYSDGDTYAIDGYGEYQPSEEVEETSDRMSTEHFTYPILKSPRRLSSYVCVAIFCLTLVIVGASGCLAGGTAFYFLQVAPTSSAQNVTNVQDTQATEEGLGSRLGNCLKKFLKLPLFCDRNVNNKNILKIVRGCLSVCK